MFAFLLMTCLLAPPRVVSLAPSLTEIIYALGVEPVGVTRYDDYPPSVVKLPKVGGFIDPEPEAILALKPDWVVAIPTSGGRGRTDMLQRLGLRVVVLRADTLSDLYVAIAQLGTTLNRRSEAVALETRIRRELQQVAQDMRGQPHRNVLILVGQRPLVAAGPGTFLDQLLPLVNASNVMREGGTYPVLDVEALAQLHPDVVVDVSMNEASTLKNAVKITDAAVLRLGPRVPEAARLLAKAIRKTP